MTRATVVRQLIVRRNLDPGYYDFLRSVARARDLDFVVDRRMRDRRQWVEPVAGERRYIRRGWPPESWDTVHFIVVDPPGSDPPVAPHIDSPLSVQRLERFDHRKHARVGGGDRVVNRAFGPHDLVDQDLDLREAVQRRRLLRGLRKARGKPASTP
jgi:hypothetical protein